MEIAYNVRSLLQVEITSASARAVNTLKKRNFYDTPVKDHPDESS